MKKAKRNQTIFGLNTSRTQLALARAALALLRPDFVPDQERKKDAAYLSQIASQINDPEQSCQKED